MALQLSYRGPEGEIKRVVLQEMAKPVETALAGALREAADLIQKRGRDNIRSAGFTSRRWVNGFNARVEVRRDAGVARSTINVFHRVGFAGIFEEGGTIVGKPFLYVPVQRNLPPGENWTPRRFVRTVGPLASVRGARRPILVGKPPGFDRAVPVFVGVRSVNIRKRFNILAVVDRVMSEFEKLYKDHLE